MSDDHRIAAGLAPEGGLFPGQAFAWVYGPPIKNPALKGLNTSSDEVNPGRDLTGRNRSAGPQTQGKPWAETKAPGSVSLAAWSPRAEGAAHLNLQSGGFDFHRKDHQGSLGPKQRKASRLGAVQ